MLTASVLRGILVVLGCWAALGVLRYKPWVREETAARGGQRQVLKVGFLPVT